MREAATATQASQHRALGLLRLDSANTIRPVTVRQLKEATQVHSGAPFKIAGVEVDYVATVANVLQIRTKKEAVYLDLEDGSRIPMNSPMTAHYWLDRQPHIILPTHSKPFYARIIGKLKPPSDKEYTHSLEISLLSVVADPHQLFFHILETAFVTLSIERGPPPGSVKENVEPRAQTGGVEEEIPAATAPNTPAVVRTLPRSGTPVRPVSPAASPSIPSTPSRSTPLRDRATPSASQASSSRPAEPPRTPTVSPPTSPTPTRQPPASSANGAIGAGLRPLRRDPYAQLSVLERAILLQILNAPPSEGGVSVRTIARGVSHHNVTQQKVSDALDALSNQRYITQSEDGKYRTIRTGHYPSA
ncbi:hypothetical protein GY45DRAFT_1315943 [Cubamyces sp. BRFM 1775]|nr:hypothetical protein GY45DRAFT_1315943 [Cubamyces sp. BRFM 1775]